MRLRYLIASWLFALCVGTVFAKGGGGGGGGGGGSSFSHYSSNSYYSSSSNYSGSDDSAPWWLALLMMLGLMMACVNCSFAQKKRVEFWSEVQEARKRQNKRGTMRRGAPPGPTMNDLVASALTPNNTSRHPGYVAHDTYDVRYVERGRLFGSTLQLYFKAIRRKRSMAARLDGGDEERATLWKIAGNGVDADGVFDIVEGYVDGSSGYAYWIERQRQRSDEDGMFGHSLYALSQGKFEFSSNSYRGRWEASNGVSGAYVRFQGRKPVVEAVVEAVPADYGSILTATIVDDQVQGDETNALLVV